MNDKAMKVTLENFMKIVVEQKANIIKMLRGMNQRMEQLSTVVNEYTIQLSDQPTPNSHHIDISTDGYIDAIMDAHTNMSLMNISILLKMLLSLQMKKLKIFTLTYLQMDMMIMLNVNITFYLLMMI